MAHIHQPYQILSSRPVPHHSVLGRPRPACWTRPSSVLLQRLRNGESIPHRPVPPQQELHGSISTPSSVSSIVPLLLGFHRNMPSIHPPLSGNEQA
ncbi:hypothetical protein SRHO_G00278040 [Serrasalmus rhombeus]